MTRKRIREQLKRHDRAVAAILAAGHWRGRRTGIVQAAANEIMARSRATKPHHWEGGVVRDRRGPLVVIQNRYWADYSRRKGWFVQGAYLVGSDDGQLFATRIPGTITTVREALHWLEPAEVRRARAAGRWTARQGDVYLIETRREPQRRARVWRHTEFCVAERHAANPIIRRGLFHPEHGTVTVPTNVKHYNIVPQKAVGVGMRARGD